MDNSANIETLLARWLAGELSGEELALFRQREDYADLKKIVDGMDGLAPPPFDDSAAWERLASGRPPREEGSPNNPDVKYGAKMGGHRIILMRRILSIAAAVAALLAVGWWIFAAGGNTYDNTFTTGTGEQLELKLPDGSTVNLNAVSKLEYASADWPDKRILHLDGEAHFRVRKGSTFTVETNQGQVVVVGTIFNVFVRDGEMDVKCTHGKVQVISPQEQKVLIKAGEQVSVHHGKLQKRRGIDFTPKWFRGESVFKTTPLPKVFAELERQFGATVIHKGLDSRSFSGKFKHDNFAEAAKRICKLMELDCTVKADTLWVGY